MKKRVFSFAMVIVLLLAAIPTASTVTTASPVGGFLKSHITTIATTVMTRQFANLMKTYSESDVGGANVAGLVYQYMAGPTGMKLNTLLTTTAEISQELDVMQTQLLEMEDRLEDSIDGIAAILDQAEVYDEQQRITAITALYSPAYQGFENLVDTLHATEGDYNGDGIVNEDDAEAVNDAFRTIYTSLPERNFKDDMTALADIVADSDGVSISADVVGGHDANDQTYIKAVKVRAQQISPFTLPVREASTYAANYVFQKQAQMLTLYAEMMTWLEGELASNTGLTDAKREQYQEDYDSLSANYANVYNMTVNSINNAAEQLGLTDMMAHEDAVYIDEATGVPMYMMQTNIAVEEGISYNVGNLYYIPQAALSSGDYFYEHLVNTWEDNDHTDTPIDVDDLQYTANWMMNTLMRDGTADASILPVSRPEDAADLLGNAMLTSSGSMPLLTYLNTFGVPVESSDYTLFSLGDMLVLETNWNGFLDSTKELVSTQTLTGIESGSFVQNTTADSLQELHVKNLYEANNTFTVLLKSQQPHPESDITYVTDGVATVTTAPSTGTAGELVNFTVSYPTPQYTLDTVTAKRANGEEITLNVNYALDDSGNTFEFLMPYQDVTVEIALRENRSTITTVTEHGTIDAPESALWGDTVQLSLTADIGYVSGTVAVTWDGGDVTLSDDQSFVMPEGGVTVQATFQPIADYSTMLGGSGTQDDPYQITSAADWNALAQSMYMGASTDGCRFALTQDIDFSGMTAYALGTSDNPFAGTLSGSDHSITGFDTLEYYGGERAALITAVGENGVLDALTFADATLPTDTVGAIVGINEGTIVDCTVDATVKTENGSFVYENTGLIRACSSSALTVSGIAYTNDGEIEDAVFSGQCTAAGIVHANHGSVSGCTNSGTMLTGATAGIAVYNSGLVDYCINHADITSFDSRASFVGGIVGRNETNGIVINCANLGNIGNGKTSYVGGIAGHMADGSAIANSYNRGTIQGYIVVGGLVGSVLSAENGVELTLCYSAGEVAVVDPFDGEVYLGALVGVVFHGNNLTISTLPSHIQGEFSALYAAQRIATDDLCLIGSYNNALVAKDIARFISRDVIVSTGFVAQLNQSVADYNQLKNEQIKAKFWSLANGVNDGLPFHADEVNAPIHEETSPSCPAPEVNNSPQTGEEHCVLPWVVLALALAVITFTLRRRSKTA